MDEATSRMRYNEAANDLWRSEQNSRWSFILRPTLSVDGDHWCALLGENIVTGVTGFGESPDAAYADFDRAWVMSRAATKGDASHG